MKIIDQSHKILRMDDPDIIEVAGRTCYKSEDKIGCTLPKDSGCTWLKDYLGVESGPMYDEEEERCAQYECPNHSSHQFSRMLIKRRHDAMLEHGRASVRFVTNRGVTHELVRHRVASYGQESTRYVNYGGSDIAFIRPVWIDSKPLGRRFWKAAMRVSEWAYKALIGVGWQAEEAREVLPNSLKTEIVVTTNYREWRHIFQLRAIGTTGRPHPQMQALMLPVLREFQERLPALFSDLES